MIKIIRTTTYDTDIKLFLSPKLSILPLSPSRPTTQPGPTARQIPLVTYRADDVQAWADTKITCGNCLIRDVFLAPTGDQEVTIFVHSSVRPSVRPSGPSLSRALFNQHFLGCLSAVLGLSWVFHQSVGAQNTSSC